jgi:catechol 2,3-dioxygenase-like lactoylglutathione lyase family enzyme
MARGLDHIVHAVRDLDAAAALYRRLGFQVGARNRHPPAWGTQNHIVQLPGTFVELLTIADPSGIVPPAQRHFSFGAFNRDFLARHQGLSMLVLEGQGAVDAEAFRAAGIGDFETYDFEREAKRPDGTPIKVAFTLAFAADPRAPEIGFFTCRHRHPENFWNPAFQTHANTATAVAGVVLVADQPVHHQSFLSAFAGAAEWRAGETGIAATLARGEIAVLTPRAVAERFSVPPPDVARGGRIAALRFSVRDFDEAAARLQKAEPAARLHGGRIIIGPDEAMGATLVFETGGSGQPAL